MPVAAMDKYDCPEFWENDVGTAGQVLAMKPEAIAEPMKVASDRPFGASMACRHALHDASPLFWRSRIHCDIAGYASVNDNIGDLVRRSRLVPADQDLALAL